MLALTLNHALPQRWPMQVDAKRAFGLAIRSIRKRRDESQAAVAARLDVTPQAWQRYEAGDREPKPERVEQIAEALGVTVSELRAEQMRIRGGEPPPQAPPTTGAPRSRGGADFVAVWGRARAGDQGAQVYDASGAPDEYLDLKELLGPGTDALRLAGDSMSPWAEPGELVIFNRGRWPKRGHGCVVETKAGEYYVKLYEKSDGSTLYVRQLNPERSLNFPMSDLKGVYAIKLRGD